MGHKVKRKTIKSNKSGMDTLWKKGMLDGCVRRIREGEDMSMTYIIHMHETIKV